MNIEDLKARASVVYADKDQESQAKEDFQSHLKGSAPSNQTQPDPGGRRLPSELQSQLASLEKDMLKVNATEQKIDLGPLPEAARRKIAGAEDDNTGNKTNTPLDQVLKEKTEKACAPMDFGELIMTGRVQQDVPVLPGKLKVTFQSLTGAESYWVERMMSEQPTELGRSWAVYMQLAMTVHAVNGSMREPFNIDGKIDRAILERRLSLLMKMNTRLIELLIANMFWFFDRVNSLYDNDFESIKNG
jgi:hypothetical protein